MHVWSEEQFLFQHRYKNKMISDNSNQQTHQGPYFSSHLNIKGRTMQESDILHTNKTWMLTQDAFKLRIQEHKAALNCNVTTNEGNKKDL